LMLEFNEADATFTERTAQPQARNDAELFRALLERHPGIGAREFEDAAVKAGMGRDHARRFLTNGKRDGIVRVERGDRNKYHHYLQGAADDWLQ
jgi:hypothetical protein